MRLYLVLAALALAACVAPPVAPGEAPPLVVQSYDARLTLEAASARQDQVMRQIMAATANAQSTADAYAFTQRQTADAQAAAEAAHELSVTQTSESIYLSLTQVAITNTSQAQQAAATATAGMATGTAQALAPTATYEAAIFQLQLTEVPRRAAAEARLAISRENRAEAVDALQLIFAVVFVVVVSGGFLILLWQLMEIIFFRLRLATPGNIPVWLAVDGPQVIEHRPLLAAHSQEPDYEEPRTIRMDGREVLAMTDEEARAIEERTAHEARARKLVKLLLRDTTDYWYGHPAWERERRIPGHRDFASVGFSWWDVEKWTIATDALGEHVEKIRGKGTFIRGQVGIGELWEMTRKDYPPTLRARVAA